MQICEKNAEISTKIYGKGNNTPFRELFTVV